jgi:hypothetical protein
MQVLYCTLQIDKVGVNMARIFGEAEASKRRILTADNVTQDDNGLRELIKVKTVCIGFESGYLVIAKKLHFLSWDAIVLLSTSPSDF